MQVKDEYRFQQGRVGPLALRVYCRLCGAAAAVGRYQYYTMMMEEFAAHADGHLAEMGLAKAHEAAMRLDERMGG